MVILICGGRDYTDAARVDEVLADAVARAADSGAVTIVHGDAAGADRLAGVWAREHSYRVREYPVTSEDWRTHGKVAGMLRNQRMLDDAKPDFGVVFPGGNGTEDMMKRLFRAGVETRVVGRRA